MLQSIGEIIKHMLLFMGFVLLFPLLAVWAVWQCDANSVGFLKVIFGVFGPFAIAIWYGVVIHGALLDGQVVDSAVRQKDKWSNHPFLLVFGMLTSSFVGEFIAITVNTQNTIYKAVPTELNWRGYEAVGFNYGYRWSFVILLVGALFIPTLVALFRAVSVFSESPAEYYAETQRREEEQSSAGDVVRDWEIANKPDDLWEKEYHPKYFAIQQREKKEAKQRCTERWRREHPVG